MRYIPSLFGRYAFHFQNNQILFLTPWVVRYYCIVRYLTDFPSLSLFGPCCAAARSCTSLLGHHVPSRDLSATKLLGITRILMDTCISRFRHFKLHYFIFFKCGVLQTRLALLHSRARDIIQFAPSYDQRSRSCEQLSFTNEVIGMLPSSNFLSAKLTASELINKSLPFSKSLPLAASTIHYTIYLFWTVFKFPTSQKTTAYTWVPFISLVLH